MKKFLSIIFVGVTVLFLAGCGKTEILECKLTQGSDSIFMDMTSTFKFEKNVATVVGINISMEGESEESAEGFELMVPVMDSVYEEYAKIDGVTYESTFENGVFNMLFEINYNELDETELLELENLDIDVSNENRTGSITELKNELETQGYTCILK